METELWIFKILYQINWLFFLHLFSLLGFYFASPSATYFSVISFCLSYCFCGLLFTGGRVVVPFASVVCFLVGEIGPEACVSFLVAGLSVCAPVMGTESFLSDEQGLFWDVCEPRITRQPIYWWVGLYFCLAACLAWSLEALESRGTGVHRQLGGVRAWCWNTHFQDSMQINILWTLVLWQYSILDSVLPAQRDRGLIPAGDPRVHKPQLWPEKRRKINKRKRKQTKPKTNSENISRHQEKQNTVTHTQRKHKHQIQHKW